MKGVIKWIKDNLSGIHHCAVVLKPGQLTSDQRATCFGVCASCDLQRGLKLTLGSANPLQPSLKSRVNCSLNDAWVSPIRNVVSSETCPRRVHLANKQMESMFKKVKVMAVREEGVTMGK